MDKLDPIYTTESIHGYHSPRYLNFANQFWRRRQPWLESQGYMLRPRFRHGWQPSWTMGTRSKRDAEDAVEHWRFSTLDATRMSDGQLVYLKRVEHDRHGPLERDISMSFSSGLQSSDPRNHCVHVLDVLYYPEEQCTYLVLLALRPFNSPDFLTVGEAVNFFQQIFEARHLTNLMSEAWLISENQGLLFMHENFVAHRDCCDLNIMMDPSEMYPGSFHPANVDKARDYQGRARHRTRTQCWPKCNFIDFGLSRKYDPTCDEWPPLEPILRGIDKTFPEYQTNDEPCNPFPADVYYIGNVIRKHFLERFRGLSFMDLLIAQMVAEEPNLRPPMHDVVIQFQGIRRALTSSKLRSRLAKRGEFPIAKCWRAGAHLARQLVSVQYLSRENSRNKVVGPVPFHPNWSMI